MKENLKTFPKCVDDECDGFAACKWKKAFEKELRELLEKCPRLRKEILGE